MLLPVLSGRGRPVSLFMDSLNRVIFMIVGNDYDHSGHTFALGSQ